MANLSKLTDFQDGTTLYEYQLDNEFQQLIDGHNNHETRILSVEGLQGSSYYTKTQVDDIIVAAEFGTPPTNGVTLTYMTPGIRAGIIAAKMYGHSMNGGF